MLPLCKKAGVGAIPWSPLARGVAARPHDQFAETARGETDSYLQGMPYLQGGGEAINDRIQELADEKGVSMAQIGLAWLLQHESVYAPIVGTTNIEHLEDAVATTELDLSDSDRSYLEEPYEPLSVAGHE